MPPASAFRRHATRLALTGSALAALSACTNGTITTTVPTPDGGTTTLTATTYGVPEGETLPVATYDSATDSWTVTDGTDTATLIRSSADTGGFRAYGSGSSLLWVAESPSGDLVAGFAVTDPAKVLYSVGGTLARLSDGTIPTGGTASYTGSYGGVLQLQTGSRSAQYLVDGDAALTANFDAGTVSGEITNRQQAGIGPMADLTLSSTSISGNGTFSGTATGGNMDPSGTTPGTTSGGTYDGLFGGDDGDEVAVGVQIEHAYDGDEYYETGAFIATQ